MKRLKDTKRDHCSGIQKSKLATWLVINFMKYAVTFLDESVWEGIGYRILYQYNFYTTLNKKRGHCGKPAATIVSGSLS